MNELTRLLHNVIPHAEAGRSMYTLHSSDVTKPEFCPREYYLYANSGRPPPGQYISTASAITFAYGNFMSSYLRNVWLRDYVVGDWVCVKCGKKETFCKNPDAKHKGTCLAGTDCKFAYQELHITNIDSRVSSSLDLTIDLGDGLPKIVELKTMGKKEFDGLLAPLTEHLVRTNLYLHTVKNSKYRDLINTEEAIILYTCKGFGTKDPKVRDYNPKDGLFSPFKEHVVKYKYDILKPYLGIIGAVDQAFLSGVPPKGVCPDSSCSRSDSCGVVDLCFGHTEVPVEKRKKAKTTKKP